MNESIRDVLRSTLLCESPDFSKMSKKELEDAKQMYKDVIDTNKSLGRPVKQDYLDKVAKIDALLTGSKESTGVVSDASVFGHPQSTSHPKFRNLIPIRVRTKAQVNKFIDKAQKAYESLMIKYSKEEAIALGRVKATPARKKKAQKNMKARDFSEMKSYAEMSRDETMKELKRLLKLVK